jgi:hypothetical protein
MLNKLKSYITGECELTEENLLEELTRGKPFVKLLKQTIKTYQEAGDREYAQEMQQRLEVGYSRLKEARDDVSEKAEFYIKLRSSIDDMIKEIEND